MSEEAKAEEATKAPKHRVLDLDKLIEAHEDGIWRDLITGGRLKIKYRIFEYQQQLARLRDAYRKANNLPLDAPIPDEVDKEHQNGLLRSVTVDFDGSTFRLGGQPVPDRDADGNVHQENLDRVLGALCRVSDTRGAVFIALNGIGSEITAAEATEEKNSSTPLPTS